MVLGSTLFLLYISDLPDDAVISNIAICVGDTILFSNCDQASDFWQQIELVFEVESNLQDIVDWGNQLVVDFNAGKRQLFCFAWSNISGATDVKMDGSALEEKSSFKMLGLTPSSKLDWAHTLSLLLNLLN